MAKQADVVVVGGGHNALVLAAYLAEAGVGITVVERNTYLGGGVVTKPDIPLPGYKTDMHSTGHGFILANPLIKQDELGLKSKYGLKYILPELVMSFPFKDGACLRIYRDVDKTCASIAEISPADADRYRRFYETTKEPFETMVNSFWAPPAPFGAAMAQLEQTESGRYLQKSLLMSSVDLAEDLFTDHHMKMFVVKWTTEAMQMPYERGTGGMFWMMVPFMHAYGQGLPVGGSAGLTDALAAHLLDHGAEIICGNPATRVKVQGKRARSVVLASGEEIVAKKAVVASLHPKIWMPLVGEENLPASMVRDLHNLKQSGVKAMRLCLAVKEPIRLKHGEDLTKSMVVELGGEDLDDLYMRNEVRIRLGLPPAPKLASLAFTQLSQHDPTRAPEGMHAASIYSFVPYHLKDGGPGKWDEIKEEVADNLILTFQEEALNLDSNNIIGRYTESPLDMERNNPCFVEGDILGLGYPLFQQNGMRPIPALSQYRTPIEWFYICGPTTHPGGGVNGGARIAARVLLEDLGIDPEKVMSLG